MRAQHGQVRDAVDGDKPVQLGNHLLDDGGCAARHNRDPRHGIVLADVSDGQTFDVVAARREHPRNAREHAAFIVHGDGERVTLNRTSFYVH